jgi:hypothetical protein
MSTATTPQSHQSLKTTLSYTLLLACPILIALPPRKLDWHTFGLAAVFVFSGGQLLREKGWVRVRKGEGEVVEVGEEIRGRVGEVLGEGKGKGRDGKP